jgi:hypothetical protein
LNKALLLVIILSIYLSCKSERSKCLNNNGLGEFQTSQDDACLGFIISFNGERISRQNGDQRSASNANSFSQLYLVECLRLNYERNQCNKKSDIIPATW